VINYTKFEDSVSLWLMRDRFLNNQPFPWILIDHFLEPGYCEELASGFSKTLRGKDPYRDSSRLNVQHKITNTFPALMTQVQKDFFKDINSEKFVSYLEVITDIKKIYPDFGLYGGGLHEIHNNGFLKIHTDFNLLPSTGKHRALNLMVYLNPEWDESWGGCLEIWPA